jgi:hypothetical protein
VYRSRKVDTQWEEIMSMKLMINGQPARVGMGVEDFRGNKYILTGWREPHKPSSTGRVYVKESPDDFASEYFPSVVGGEFV